MSVDREIPPIKTCGVCGLEIGSNASVVLNYPRNEWCHGKCYTQHRELPSYRAWLNRCYAEDEMMGELLGRLK